MNKTERQSIEGKLDFFRMLLPASEKCVSSNLYFRPKGTKREVILELSIQVGEDAFQRCVDIALDKFITKHKRAGEEKIIPRTDFPPV